MISVVTDGTYAKVMKNMDFVHLRNELFFLCLAFRSWLDF